jgi:hypothetical protein
VTRPAYWTEADAAEAALLAREFVEAFWKHGREEPGCADCRELGRWCRPLEEAWEAIEGWRERRHLLSRAQHSRVQRILELRALTREAA